MVVSDEGSQRSHTTVMVVPDSSGEGKESLEHSGDDAARRASTMLFQVELAFQGVVDRFDELAQGLQEPCTRPWWLSGLGRPNQSCVVAGQERLELSRGVALVGQDHLPGTDQPGLDLEEVPRNLAFVHLGVGQSERDGKPSRRARQVEPKAPEVSGVAGAVAVAGEPDQIAPLCCRAGAPALHRRRVDDPGVIVGEIGIGGQYPNHAVEQGLRLSEPFVVAGLVGHVREEGTQMLPGMSEESCLGGVLRYSGS